LNESAAGFEGEIAGNKQWKQHCATGNDADEPLVAQPATQKPIDCCAASGAKMIRLRGYYPALKSFFELWALSFVLCFL